MEKIMQYKASSFMLLIRYWKDQEKEDKILIYLHVKVMDTSEKED
jgi:hypothetical protein